MTASNKITACLLTLGLMAGAAHVALAQSAAPAYMNGGIGEGEQDKIKAAAQDYNLHLLFSQGKGEYISDVKLDVADANGSTIFSLPSAGPMTNVKLPDGKYKVTASYNGQIKTQSVSIMSGKGGKASNLSFRWGGEEK